MAFEDPDPVIQKYPTSRWGRRGCRSTGPHRRDGEVTDEETSAEEPGLNPNDADERCSSCRTTSPPTVRPVRDEDLPAHHRRLDVPLRQHPGESRREMDNLLDALEEREE